MYEDMTFETIQEKTLSRVRGDIDKREGSLIWDATAAVSYHLAQMYFQMEHYLNLIFLDTTVSDYLDRICLSYNITRKPATKAERKVTADGELIVGSRWQIQDTSYMITIKTGNKEYLATCEQHGNIGNLYFGELQPIENSTVHVELGEIVTIGTDEETDEALRERLLNKIRRPSTSGNANDYYNWALECAGIGAAKVFPLANGPGTVKVVVADENKKAASTTLLKAVKEHIEELRPIGATVTVSSAREKVINIGAKVRLSTGTNLGTIQNLFRDCASKYLADNSFTADYISLARVGNLLLEITGVEDYTDLQLNGSSGNIALQAEEIAVIGEVRLEVMQ